MLINRTLILTAILFVYSISLFSQEQDTVHNVQKTKNVGGLIAIGSVTPIALAGVYIYMNKVWWNEEKMSFHVSDDSHEMKYALGLDKLGHFTASCLVSNSFCDLLKGAGVSENCAIWGGAGLAFLNASVIEIKDGHAPRWGFSKYDELANLLGAFYPVLQAKVPIFSNFNFKWSYDLSHQSEYMKNHPQDSFIDDYDRENFWLTIDWADLFLKNRNTAKFPYCFDLAIGISAEGIDGMGGGKREVFIGIDFNFSKLKFTKWKGEKYVWKYLNFYHTPMPAVKVSPETKAYLLTY